MTSGVGPVGTGQPAVTNARQAEKYQNRAQMCLYLAGGLGGIALFAAADYVFLTTTHPVFGAVLLTLGLLAGAALGLAHTGFQWELTQIRRHIEDGLAGSDEYNRSLHPPNAWYEREYRAGSILVFATGAWLVISAWVSVASAPSVPHDRNTPIHLTCIGASTPHARGELGRSRG